MADDLDESEDDRAVELSAISAIYPELIVDSTDPFSASISIAVEPVKPLTVVFLPLENGDFQTGLLTPSISDDTEDQVARQNVSTEPHQDVANQDIHHLSHLPPLTLIIHLQNGYPSRKPPLFHLEAETPWIPEARLKVLRDVGSSIWEDMGKDQVVFSYIDHLREAAERSFDVIQKGRMCLEISQNFKIALLDYDSRMKRAKFEQETFDCGVCLEPKKGLVCHRLLACSHVFCVACLQDFFNTCITEGDVSNVSCMTPNCGRDPKPDLAVEVGRKRKRRRQKDRTLQPSELLQIPLDQEIVQRYIKLKRKAKLESDRTTVYCPRQWCQGPARSKQSENPEDGSSDSESESEEPRAYDPNAHEETLPPPAERLAICEDCTFAFCKVCKASWHGEFYSCFPRKQTELTAEELATAAYMQFHTTPCPTCDARCQKTMGCNHMICFKCNSHFCYLCSSWLDQDNPYEHFNTRAKACYMRLWELEAGDGDNVGIGFAGGAPDLVMDDDDDDTNDGGLAGAL